MVGFAEESVGGFAEEEELQEGNEDDSEDLTYIKDSDYASQEYESPENFDPTSDYRENSAQYIPRKIGLVRRPPVQDLKVNFKL